MSENRCDLSDLLVEQCDHCKKGAKTLDDSPQIVSIYAQPAKYHGKCSCGKRFQKGDIIGWSTKDEWWRVEKCCPKYFE